MCNENLLGLVPNQAFGVVEPKINVFKKNGYLTIEINVPGFERGELEVVVEGRILKIRGEHSQELLNKLDGCLLNEFKNTNFSRSLPLPENVKVNTILSSLALGILTINMLCDEPKKAESRKIKIE